MAGPGLLGHDVLPPCLFRSLTGWDCPFCGGTRATRALLSGDVPAAFDHNILVPLLAALGVIAAGWWLLSRVLPTVDFAPVQRVATSRGLWITAGVVLIVFWLVRNLPAFSYLASPG